MEFQLWMPPSISAPEPSSVPNHGVVVIVGANGSGKTRLGAWIELESKHKDNAHRVSAQKSLDMPFDSSPTSIEKARGGLLYGHEGSKISAKLGNRWRSRPSTILLNDFNRLMVYLFSDEFEKSTNYRKKAKTPNGRVEPPETKLDIIQRIWESILPNRNLIMGSVKVEVKLKEKPNELDNAAKASEDPQVKTKTEKKPNEPYNAAEMSDGERVIFYLIGECLAAPEDAVIVIDEPEMHLHKSIQSKLWDAIEAERSDCLFVYLTHDVDFAASRVGAPKVCLREFDGEKWDWYLVPKDNPIPEDVLLQIVGSRKPVLFVEGGQSSLDYFLFGYLYPDFTVVPCGPCSHVIRATQAFASLNHLHHLKCRGIVDRDYRTDETVEYLQGKGISVLEVSEIENLLLHKAILEHVGAKLEFGDDLPEIITAAQKTVFDLLEKNKMRIAASAATNEVESRFTSFDAKAQDERQLEKNWQKFVKSIDVGGLYAAALKRVQDILNNRDYEGALKAYDNKGLIYQVSSLFDLKSHGLVDYIKRLISNENDQDILAVLEQYVPGIEI